MAKEYLDWVFLTVDERVAKEMQESGCKQAVEQEIDKIRRSLYVLDFQNNPDLQQSNSQNSLPAVSSVIS